MERSPQRIQHVQLSLEFAALRAARALLDKYAWLVGVGIQTLLLAIYFDWRQIITNPPVADTDYATHWTDTWSMAHFLDQGRLWSYSPYFMAGYPANAFLDIDNKLFALFAWLASGSGLSLAAGYNLALVLAVALAPLAVYPAARWMDLTPRGALVAQVGALALWYIDPALRWVWTGGTLAFGTATFLSLLVTTAVVRIARPGGRVGLLPWITWLVLGPVLFWLHAFTFLLLVVPLTTLVVSRWSGLSRGIRLALVIWPVWVIVTNLPWLVPFIRFFSLRTRSDRFLQGGWPALRVELLEFGTVASEMSATFLGPRWLILAIGGIGLVCACRSQRAWWPIAAGVIWGLIAAYAVVHVPEGEDLQPYRYLYQALIWSTLGFPYGLIYLRRLYRNRAIFSVNLAARITGSALAALVMLWVGVGLWQARPAFVGGDARAMNGPSDDLTALCRYFTRRYEGGKVLVDDWRAGALLPSCAGVETIGGPFLYLPLEHGYSNATPWAFLRGSYRDHQSTHLQLEFEAYEIRWMVANLTFSEGWYTITDRIRMEPELGREVARFGSYVVYASFVEPQAHTTRATFNRIEIDNLRAGAAVTIPYHWMDELESMTPLSWIRPVIVYNDPVPFIRVTVYDGEQVVICLHGRCGD